jgi:RHS repeat-associated protein
MIRVGPPLPDDKTPAAKFYFGDHLGSGVLIVDGSGFWVSREEFTPYGETSFGGHVRKRFRFTGKERDEESGLTYHGVRYYAPWVARWLSCDPARSRDASSLYAYAASNPLKFVDLTGAQQQSVQYTRAEFAQQACLTAEHCSGADAGDPEPPATITPATPNQSVVEPARPEEATGAATHSVPLAEAARTAVKYGFAPVDPAGVRLAPPYNLWSGQAGEAAATAAPGFVEAGTLEGARARGMVQEWIREGKYPPAALDNPRLLSAEDFDRAWVRTSRALARQAAISEAPVENFGPTNPGSVKATVELPTIARWGAAAGVAMAAVGFLSIYASSEQPSGSPSQAILAGAGVTEVTGGIIYGSGAILANGKLMAIGSGVSTVGGSVAMLTSASRHWPLSPGQTLRPA